MNSLVIFIFASSLVACAMAGGLGVGYAGGYGGYGGSLGYGGGLGTGGGGVGVGSSVVLLRGGPGFARAIAGPAFLVRTVHHVNKVHSGGALVAHSGLGGIGGGLGYGGGYGGLGGLGYGAGLKYGGLGLGGGLKYGGYGYKG